MAFHADMNVASTGSEQEDNMWTDFDANYKFDYVPTEAGYMYVCTSKSMKKEPNKPVLVTLHDVGFNYRSSFEHFFQQYKMHSILNSFNVMHLNVPGQEPFAKDMDTSVSPFSMDQIARSIGQVMQYFEVGEFVGFGVGAGANILARYALMQPQMVNGLFLVNVSFNHIPLLESLKDRAVYGLMLNNSKASQLMRKHILGLYFSKSAVQMPVLAGYTKVYYPLGRTKPHYSHPAFNSHNFGLFLEAFLKRSKINLKRESGSNLKCTVLLVTSENSPAVEDTMKMAACLNPQNSSYLKVASSSNAMRDKPNIVAEAFQLFLQGLGYIRSYRLVGLDGDEMSGDA